MQLLSRRLATAFAIGALWVILSGCAAWPLPTSIDCAPALHDVELPRGDCLATVRVARSQLPPDAQFRITAAGLWQWQYCPDLTGCPFVPLPKMTSSDQPEFAISVWFDVADGRSYIVNVERTGETLLPSLWCEVGLSPCKWSSDSA